LLGFLRYNFNPASVFLGDSGSLTLGFMLGCFGVIWSQKSATILGMIAPMMAFALPLLEVGLSIGRRMLRSEPIFKADRGHIHHRLLHLGFHPRAAALILYGACAVAAILSLAQSSLSNHVGGFIIVLFCLLSAFGVRHLRYIEFSSFVRVVQRGLFRLVREEIHLTSFRMALRDAKEPKQSWAAVRTICKEMGFSSVELTLDGETFFEVFEKTDMDSCWHLRIGLSGSDELLLTRASQVNLPSVMGSFIHIVQEGLQHESGMKEILLPGEPFTSSRGALALAELAELDHVGTGMSAAAGDSRS
jgi:UDP-GlcNAc:undecaprenyl-phosphate GlcNAc-1-phosphate transferase